MCTLMRYDIPISSDRFTNELCDRMVSAGHSYVLTLNFETAWFLVDIATLSLNFEVAWFLADIATLSLNFEVAWLLADIATLSLNFETAWFLADIATCKGRW